MLWHIHVPLHSPLHLLMHLLLQTGHIPRMTRSEVSRTRPRTVGGSQQRAYGQECLGAGDAALRRVTGYAGQAGRLVAQPLASGPARVIVILTMTRRSRSIAAW